MRKRVMALFCGVVLLAAACGNASDDTGTPAPDGGPNTTAGGGDLTTNIASGEPGVTDTEIRVGGVASVTNPLGGNYGDAFAGVNAYFEMINDQGGIYGRDLVLAEERDDQLANNQAEVEGLISSDIFAVLPVATLLFAGADSLAASGTPTYGWNINPEWQGPPNLFGDRGSVLCFTCAYPGQPWVAQQEGLTRLGVLAYNVPQSSECAQGTENSFTTYPTAEVVFKDSALTYGVTDFSVQVGKMADAGVDVVATCMDTNGVTNLQKEIVKQGLDIVQYLPNAYDFDFVAEFGDIFEGSYVFTWFAPFETPDPPLGLQTYFEWIDRSGGPRSELSMVGWLLADLFYQGLVAAGPEFTQQSVVQATNTFTDWNVEGAIPGVDWTIEHERAGDVECPAISKIVNSEFVPQFQEPGKPFLCFDLTAASLEEPENRATAKG